MIRFFSVLLLLTGVLGGCRTVNGDASAVSTAETTIEGEVVLAKVGIGSHAESERVFLVLAGEDRKVQLRKVGENPFEQPESRALVGNVVTCTGTLNGQNFFWNECLLTEHEPVE